MTRQPVERHKPVLVKQVLQYINPQPRKTYLDVTFGSGGHTRAILEQEPTCRVVAMDWDTAALENFGAPLQEEFGDRLRLIWGNFALLYRIMQKEKLPPFAGILADFGTSQIQLAHKAGFSFYHDTPLDMRMSPAHQKITAAELLNKSSEQKLVEIFSDFGQERYAKTIARAIVEHRKAKEFVTTRDLASLIEEIISPSKRRPGLHPGTQVFQALRIAVNQELHNIISFLPVALHSLEQGGHLVCISFHSLEDRLVKQFFKDQEQQRHITILTKHAEVADEEEMKENPSSRSAKLRAAELIGKL